MGKSTGVNFKRVEEMDAKISSDVDHQTKVDGRTERHETSGRSAALEPNLPRGYRYLGRIVKSLSQGRYGSMRNPHSSKTNQQISTAKVRERVKFCVLSFLLTLVCNLPVRGGRNVKRNCMTFVCRVLLEFCL